MHDYATGRAFRPVRIDVVTIFPEYLDPLRHALLGKAIEQGRLSVGVHDLRSWATGTHKTVDSAPAGGGPGMAMTPEGCGPALDDVAAGTARGADLESATPHLDRLRREELEGIEGASYANSGEESRVPLLLLPTPTGKPFSQDDARAWSHEGRIVLACRRYEGIDHRVI